MSDFVKNADENIMNFKGRFFLYRWFCSGGYGGKTYAVFLFLKTGRCQ